MATNPQIHGPMQLSANSNLTWGGIMTMPDTTGIDQANVSNTYIFNSNSRFLLWPAEANASVKMGSNTGVYVVCTDNGTLTAVHGTGNGGTASFYFIVVGGPGTNIAFA